MILSITLKRQNTPSNNGFKNPFVPELKVYDKSVWNGLSNANRDAVRDLYQKENQNNRSGQNINLHTHDTPQSQSHPQFIPYVNGQQNNSAGKIQDRITSHFSLQNYQTMNPYRAIQTVLPPYLGTLIIPPPHSTKITRLETR